MARVLILAVALATIATALYWNVLGKRPSTFTTPSPVATTENDRVAELEQEVARLRHTVYQVSAQASTSARQIANVVAAPSPQAKDNAQPPPEDMEVVMERNRQAIAAKFDQLSSTIAKQARDPVWAASAEKELGNVVQQLQESGVKGVTVLGFECKSWMCKVEAAYDSPQAQSQISDRIRSPFFSGGEVRRYEEGGQLRSTGYYYREGYDQSL